MASTFVKYKGTYVDVPESALICVTYMLYHEAREHTQCETDKARFQAMTDEFKITTIGVGCSNLRLDELLEGDPEKEAEYLAIIELGRERLRACDNVLPADYVNRVIAVHEPTYKDGPLGTAWFPWILDVMEAVIRGRPAPERPKWGANKQ